MRTQYVDFLFEWTYVGRNYSILSSMSWAYGKTVAVISPRDGAESDSLSPRTILIIRHMLHVYQLLFCVILFIFGDFLQGRRDHSGMKVGLRGKFHVFSFFFFFYLYFFSFFGSINVERGGFLERIGSPNLTDSGIRESL